MHKQDTNYIPVLVDYDNAEHCEQLLTLLQMYALDPKGGGQALDLKVEKALISQMKKRSFVFSLLLLDANMSDPVANKAIAFANCIESFSTFKAKAVINIHDFAVLPEYRNKGVSQALMHAIEHEARKRNACKITLEVLEGNDAAKKAYQNAGFQAYELDPEMGQALFWEKAL